MWGSASQAQSWGASVTEGYGQGLEGGLVWGGGRQGVTERGWESRDGVRIPRWGEEDQGSGGREPLPLPTPTLTQNLPLQQLAARGAQQRG